MMTQNHNALRNKAIVLRFFHGTHGHGTRGNDLRVVDDLVIPGVKTHGFPGGNPDGRERYKSFFVGLNAAFPDMSFDIHGLIAEGDKVAVHFSIRATHRGCFIGFDPTGNKVDFSGMVIYRLEQGRIAEVWLQPDTATLARQLGG